MSRPLDDYSVIGMERQVLRALCQGTPEGSVRETATQILKGYRWREPLHQVVFEVLASFPTDAPETLREHLPSRLTRCGFPDVAWEDFFALPSLSKEEAERLMRRLSNPAS